MRICKYKSYDDLICKHWFEYCKTLLNEEFPRRAILDEEPFEQEIPNFAKDEVEIAIRKMKRGKAVGPDQLSAEFWRCMEDIGVQWLTILFNKIKSGLPMPDDWKSSYLIPSIV
jgi:hypothetical protein